MVAPRLEKRLALNSGLARRVKPSTSSSGTPTSSASIRIGPKRWNANAEATSPCVNAQNDRVNPQPGHGNPVRKRNGQSTGPWEMTGAYAKLAAIVNAPIAAISRLRRASRGVITLGSGGVELIDMALNDHGRD